MLKIRMVYISLCIFSCIPCLADNNWQSIPDIELLTQKAQALLESLDKKAITLHEGHSEAQDLYAQLERAIIFEQHFKGSVEDKKKEMIEKAQFLMFQLSNKFALTTPIEKLKSNYEGTLSWLSKSWSQLKGVAQTSFDTIVQQALQDKAWALDQLSYVSNGLATTLSLHNLISLLENYVGRDKIKGLLKETYMKAHGFIEPSTQIKEIAEFAMKNSSINPEKVILLEDPVENRVYDAYVLDDLPYSYMVITSLKKGRSLSSKIFTAFHECGHVYYRHSSVQAGKQFLPTIKILTMSSLFGVATVRLGYQESATLTYSSGFRLISPYLAGMLLTIVLSSFLVEASPFYFRSQEKTADLFACDRLIAIERPDIILDEIEIGKQASSEHFEQKGIVAQFKSRETHPSKPEARKYLEECLQKQDYTLKIPEGSYKESCSRCFMIGSTLYCNCFDQNGKVRRSRVDAKTCKNLPIHNCNGILKCGSC